MSANPTTSCKFDHLVVCAKDLPEGVSWFEQLSGLALPFGGSHPLMATHNHLTALSADSFLEIIATDPGAPAASHPRWFGLDNASFRESLTIAPRLTTWVVGVTELEAALKLAEAAGVDAGEVVELTRGDLHWKIGLRADGTLAYDGVFPILIQWPQGVNPVSRMQNQGLHLNKLQLRHPKAESAKHALKAIGADHLVDLASGDLALLARLSVGSHTFHIHNDVS